MHHRILRRTAVAIVAALLAVVAVGPLAIAGGFVSVATHCTGDKCK
jgi:hypothetical protein